MPSVEEMLQELRAELKDEKWQAAMARAWQLFDTAPDNRRIKLQLLSLLSEHGELATPDNQSALQNLLDDPTIDPREVAPAGWKILRQSLSAFAGAPPENTASWLEADQFAQSLLRQTYIADAQLEAGLTVTRRWLLLSGRWPEFPRATEALVDQAAHNGGAWLFDKEERIRLDADPSARIVLAFRPQKPSAHAAPDFAEATTRAVAEQYEGWPYPHWTRVTRAEPTTLAATIKKIDPDGPDTIPAQPCILVAGCGTGCDAADLAFRYPDAQITVIDISRTSLDYARERCASAGLGQIEFRLLPIDRIADLGRQFDAVFSWGVLHHMSDPEAGWSALNNALKPGGMMSLMVYSKIARMLVRGWQNMVADFLDRPVDDDLLREVRRRLITRGRVPTSRDFYFMGGVHDLLLHRHEDPFDIARIQRNVERLGQVFLRFDLPDSERAAYRRENPQDPLFRDCSLWSALELRKPLLFGHMYRFWCRKAIPASAQGH